MQNTEQKNQERIPRTAKKIFQVNKTKTEEYSIKTNGKTTQKSIYI